MAEKKLRVKLVHSTIGRVRKQEQIVRGLGLRKLNSVRELIDTPQVRGMIAKVSHLVKMVEPEVKSKVEKKEKAKAASVTKEKKVTTKSKSEVKQDEA